MNAKFFTVVLSLFLVMQGFAAPRFLISNYSGLTGEMVCLDIRTTGFTNVDTLSFRLNLGAAQHDFLYLTNFNLPKLSENNFTRKDGYFDVVWSSSLGISVPDSTSLFQVCFRIATNCDDTPLSMYPLFVSHPGSHSANNSLGFTGGYVSNLHCQFDFSGEGICLSNLLSSANAVPGDTVCIDVKTEDFAAMSIMKYSIKFDTQKLDFLHFKNLNLPGLTPHSINILQATNGKIGVSWIAPNLNIGESLPDGSALMSLCFIVKGSFGDSTLVEIVDGVDPIEFRNNTFRIVMPNILPGKIKFISEPVELKASAICIGKISCLNAATGKIEITVEGGSPPYQYAWTGPNNYSSRQEDISQLLEGVYNLVVTDSEGVNASVGPILIEQQGEIITIDDIDPILCATESIQLNTTVNHSVEGYYWISKLNLVNFSCTNCANPVVALKPTFKEIGIFKDTLQVVTASTIGCLDTAFVVISIRSYNIFPQKELFACIGDTLVLNENNRLPSSGIFRWQGPNGFSSSAPTVRIPDVTPNLSSNYTFSYTDISGCKYEANLNIKVSEYPKIVNTTLNPPICPNSFPNGSIFIELPRSEGGYTATWSGLGEPSPLVSDTLIGRVSLAAGQYFVTITNAAGCAIDTSFTLIDPPAPQVNIDVMPSCASTTAGSISLFIIGNDSPYKILWSTGDTTNTIQNLPPGNYFVNITDNKNCNIYRDILVPGTAFASKTSGGVYFGFPGSVQLTANAFNATSIRWEPADQIINGDSFTAIPEPDSVITTYIATISDGQGCEAKDTVVVVSGVSTELGFPGAERDKVTKWCYEIDDPAAYKINRIVSTDAQVLSKPKIVAGSLCIEYTSNISGEVLGDVDSIYLEICPIAGGSCEVIGGLIYVLQVVVYTGDTNDDGIVNHLDLLNIGIANGATGPFRFVNPNFWSGTATYLWEGLYTPGTRTNYAHIDADGNSRIEAIDTNVIRQFWGNTHMEANLQSPTTFEPRGIGAPLFIEANTLKPGETMRLPIILGDAATPANNAYGTAFTIQYDPAIIDTASISLEFVDSWLGTYNQDFIGLYKNFGASGKIETALTRLNQQNISGSGIIGYLNLRVREDLTGNPTVRFTIEKPVLISAQEEMLPVEPMTTEASITTSAYETWLERKISIFPNPAKEILHIRATDVTVENVILYDVNGQAVLQNSTPNSFSIESLEAGLYFCKILTDKGLITKKISVIR